MLLTGTHNFVDGMLASLNNASEKETPSEGRDIHIGEGCFIGSNVTLIGPINVGNNVLIAAGSVVYKDIPSGCLIAGNPAKVIKQF